MSFKPKKRKQLEMDELNIKSHLNASLELGGISVSEDLISRTLDAIKLKEAEVLDVGKDDMDYKKPIHLYKYTRTLVTLAAAALILVVGLNAIRMLTPLGGTKKDMTYTENDSIYQEQEEAKKSLSNIENLKNDEMADMDGSKELDSGASIGDAVSDDTSESYEVTGSIAEEDDTTSNVTERLFSLIYMLTFDDIAIMKTTDVSSIIITSMATDETKALIEQGQIDGFYEVMRQHSFAHGSAEDTISEYMVELIGEDMSSQIIIGELAITVDHVDYNNLASRSIYIISDQKAFLQDLEEVLNK